MMNDILSVLFSFFTIGLGAAFTQNVMFGRGFGLETIAYKDDVRSRRIFCRLQTVACILSGIVFWAMWNFVIPHLDLLTGFGISEYYSAAYLWPLFIALSVSPVYFLLFVLVVKFAPYDSVMTGVKVLPGACFNTMVAGVMLLSSSQRFTFMETVIYCTASSVSYHVADAFLREGDRKMEESDIPEAFRGLPATLIYLAGLALAAYSVIGHKLGGML